MSTSGRSECITFAQILNLPPPTKFEGESTHKSTPQPIPAKETRARGVKLRRNEMGWRSETHAEMRCAHYGRVHGMLLCATLLLLPLASAGGVGGCCLALVA